jgi:hypothetical protein
MKEATETKMTRTLLVSGDKEFKITIPEDAKVTFGPWSPPGTSAREKDWGSSEKRGTLRIYGRTKEDVLAVFSGVSSFRDISSIDYMEKVTVEKGSTIWESDQHGYVREGRTESKQEWVVPEVPQLNGKEEEIPY